MYDEAFLDFQILYKYTYLYEFLTQNNYQIVVILTFFSKFKLQLPLKIIID